MKNSKMDLIIFSVCYMDNMLTIYFLKLINYNYRNNKWHWINSGVHKWNPRKIFWLGRKKFKIDPSIRQRFEWYFFIAIIGKYFFFKLKNYEYLYAISLFRNRRFMLDEMFQRNASKFVILLEYKKPHSLFFISSLRATLFFHNECPGL